MLHGADVTIGSSPGRVVVLSREFWYATIERQVSDGDHFADNDCHVLWKLDTYPGSACKAAPFTGTPLTLKLRNYNALFKVIELHVSMLGLAQTLRRAPVALCDTRSRVHDRHTELTVLSFQSCI